MKKIKYFKRYANINAELKAIKKVLKSQWLTTGNVVKEFEKQFAAKAGYKYAVAVNSATSGLLLALQTSGIPKGSTIITTPFTFAATAHAIEQSGYKLQFVDIYNYSYTLDINAVQNEIMKMPPKYIGGILAVDIAGYSDIDWKSFKKYFPDVKLIYDSAHCTPGNKDEYDFDSPRVYSFYANKNLSLCEGGMICTNDESQVKQIRVLMNHGIDHDVYSRFTEATSKKWCYDIVESGFKYNMSDIQAAIGLEQLKLVDEIKQKRYQVAQWYSHYKDQHLYKPYWAEYNNHDFHLYLIKVPEDKRDYIIQELSKAGIETSVHYKPLHMMSYFKNKYGFKDEDFPNAYHNYLQTISLPIYPDLKKSEVKYICEKLNSLL